MATKPIAELGKKMYTPLPGILTAPQELTTDSYVNLAGMVVALEASYLYEFYVLLRTGGDGAGGLAKWLPPSGATMVWLNATDGVTLGGTAVSECLDETGETDIASTAGPDAYHSVYQGTIATDAAGNLQLQGKLETAPGSETVVEGYVRVQPIGPLA